MNRPNLVTIQVALLTILIAATLALGPLVVTR